MFRKILVPLDMTFKHRRAIDTAADLARQSDGEVVLLHVIELLHAMPREEEKDFYDRLETGAQTHLERHLVTLKERDIDCRKQIVFGVRAAEVLRFAQTLSADLIILTAPRIDPENPESGWGSMSYKLSFFAPCHVLLVK
ncbi:MAG TPA: universal stress protein [Gemmataceae bacterium]|jgi:nucleotide-binding universal stress UspA family protein